MARYVCATPTFTTDSFHHDTKYLRYSSIITLKKLACAITHALHEQQKYRGMFASAREIDDVSTARRVLKNSLRV